MTFHIPNLSGDILIYFLVFARTGAMVMLLPAIGEQTIPAQIRLVLALGISLALAPTVVGAYHVTQALTTMTLALLIAKEITAGVLIGTMARIVMSALQVAGAFIAMQTGLAYAQALDPTQGQQSAEIGNFLSLLGTVMIFATNLHHLAIGAVAGSYTLIPPGAPLPTADMAQLTIRLVSGSFALGLQLAAPFLVFGFAVSAAIGLLQRLMPQMQVFFVAMPVNILAGLFLMMLLIGAMMTIFLNFYSAQMAQFLS